jgi:hypothetical protein
VPGKTDGSGVFKFPEHEVAFVGDLLCTISPFTGPVHRGTLLRLVIDLPDPQIRAAPQVLGVARGQLHQAPVVGPDPPGN